MRYEEGAMTSHTSQPAGKAEKPASSRGLLGLCVRLALAGVALGTLAFLLERNPALNYGTLWYGSFATGSVGIWVTLAAVVGLAGTSPRRAFARVVALLGGALVAYIALRYSLWVAALVGATDAGGAFVAGSDGLADTLATALLGLVGQGSALWPVVHWVVAALAAAGIVLVAALCAGAVHMASRKGAAYWAFCAPLVLVVVFEAWAYFVPMALHGSDYLPALVDVCGGCVVAWMLVRYRNAALTQVVPLIP
jgi:hypothetical protein